MTPLKEKTLYVGDEMYREFKRKESLLFWTEKSYSKFYVMKS